MKYIKKLFNKIKELLGKIKLRHVLYVIGSIILSIGAFLIGTNKGRDFEWQENFNHSSKLSDYPEEFISGLKSIYAKSENKIDDIKRITITAWDIDSDKE